jgi:hypothetical protein
MVCFSNNHKRQKYFYVVDVVIDVERKLAGIIVVIKIWQKLELITLMVGEKDLGLHTYVTG